MRDTIEINDQKITVIEIISWWQSKPILLPHRIIIVTIFTVISECGHNFGITYFIAYTLNVRL